MARKPTQRQREVLEFVRDTMRNEAKPPTVREIADHFGFKSPKAASDHLMALERKGYLTRTVGKSRNIRIREELSPDGIPLLGKITRRESLLSLENLDGSLRPAALFSITGRTVAIRADDDAMADAGIRKGDYLVVESSETVESGGLAAVRRGENLLVRRVFFENGTIRLASEGPGAEETVLDSSEPDTEVLGPVKGLIRAI